jgi:UDP-glucose 4-epimerase
MTILVTGGAGYIGSHLISALQAIDQIIVMDLVGGLEKKNSRVLYLECDVRDKLEVKSIFKKYNFRTIYHLAGLKTVVNSNSTALTETNVSGLQNLLSVVEPEVNIIFTSSAAIYQSKPTSLPIKEDEPCVPISNYGHTKLLGENLLRNHRGNSVSLRLFNVAGKVPDVEYISTDANVVPSFIRSIYRKEPLKIHGNSYSTNDGYAVRDYIHISDVVSALVHAGEALESGIVKGSESFNVSTGIGTSVFELIKMMEIMTKISPGLQILPAREGEIEVSIGNSSKLSRHTNWQTRHSIEDLIKSEIDAYNQNH